MGIIIRLMGGQPLAGDTLPEEDISKGALLLPQRPLAALEGIPSQMGSLPPDAETPTHARASGHEANKLDEDGDLK